MTSSYSIVMGLIAAYVLAARADYKDEDYKRFCEDGTPLLGKTLSQNSARQLPKGEPVQDAVPRRNSDQSEQKQEKGRNSTQSTHGSDNARLQRRVSVRIMDAPCPKERSRKRLSTPAASLRSRLNTLMESMPRWKRSSYRSLDLTLLDTGVMERNDVAARGGNSVNKGLVLSRLRVWSPGTQ